MASPRQLIANRQNALSSTGPKTPEGKDASRRNALKHGLSGAGVVLPADEIEAVEARAGEWRNHFEPADDLGEWYFRELVVNTVKVDLCRQKEATLRSYLADRASAAWDEDRRALADELGERLPKAPALVAKKLSGTKHGCDWMLERWTGLGVALDRGASWNDSQRSLALDLLGTPAELREGHENLGAAAGCPVAKSIVVREVGRLERAKAEKFDRLDAAERAAAAIGHEVECPRELSLARRYEAACLRQVRWAEGRLKSGRRDAPDSPPPPREADHVPPARDDSVREGPTEAELAEYDAHLTRQLFASRDMLEQAAARIKAPPRVEPEPEPPAPVRFSASVTPAPPALNRRQRRYAEKLAAGRR